MEGARIVQDVVAKPANREKKLRHGTNERATCRGRNPARTYGVDAGRTASRMVRSFRDRKNSPAQDARAAGAGSVGRIQNDGENCSKDDRGKPCARMANHRETGTTTIGIALKKLMYWRST